MVFCSLLYLGLTKGIRFKLLLQTLIIFRPNQTTHDRMVQSAKEVGQH